MRNFDSLTGIAPKKDLRRPLPQAQRDDPHSQKLLGDLAHELGFRSSAIWESREIGCQQGETQRSLQEPWSEKSNNL